MRENRVFVTTGFIGLSQLDDLAETREASPRFEPTKAQSHRQAQNPLRHRARSRARCTESVTQARPPIWVLSDLFSCVGDVLPD
jgi:hypothetical protein